MKTVMEVLQNHHYPVSIGSIEDRINLVEAVKDYTRQVLDHMMENAPEYIYIDHGSRGDYDTPDEAVFSYEAVDELKKSLK